MREGVIIHSTAAASNLGHAQFSMVILLTSVELNFSKKWHLIMGSKDERVGGGFYRVQWAMGRSDKSTTNFQKGLARQQHF